MPIYIEVLGAERQLLSLLYAVFESASGVACAATIDTKLSAKENLEILISFFDCDHEPDVHPFGSLEEAIMEQALRRCTLFEGEHDIDVAEMIKDICAYVPVGFQNGCSDQDRG